MERKVVGMDEGLEEGAKAAGRTIVAGAVHGPEGAGLEGAMNIVEGGVEAARLVAADNEAHDSEREASIMDRARQIKADDPGTSGADAIGRARQEADGSGG